MRKKSGKINQRLIFTILFAFFLIFSKAPLVFPEAYQQQEEWLVEKGAHFIVSYPSNIKRSYVKLVLRGAEKYYESITEKLGFRRFDFWTWDKRCKIYLYSSSLDYYNKTKQPEWSKASVRIIDKSIHTFSINSLFLNNILPHEMGHLIFREFVGSRAVLPLWLDEGIATLTEGNKGKRLAYAKAIVDTPAFIPLKRLTYLNVEGITDPETFYAEASSVIEFLLREYGKDKFVEYCRSLRDQKNWYQGFEEIYGFENISAMHEKWVEFLQKEN